MSFEEVCDKCGINPSPVLYGDILVKPCGQVKDENWFLTNIPMHGCPMTRWQDGYGQALKDEKEKRDREPPPKKRKTFIEWLFNPWN